MTDYVNAGPNRSEVEKIVKLHFEKPEDVEISYESGGISRAVQALPVDLLDEVIYENLRPHGDHDGKITDSDVTLFRAIDFDIAHVLKKAEKKRI